MHSPNSDEQRELMPSCNLALTKVVSTGHSAGGHLALWLAAHTRSAFFAQSSPLACSQLRSENEEIATPLLLAGAISLAGVVDLEMAWRLHVSHEAVVELLDGSIASVPKHSTIASPSAMLPLGIPHVLLHGTRDDSVPLQVSQAYAKAAKSIHDLISYLVEGVDHFDDIDPHSEAQAIPINELQKLVSQSKGQEQWQQTPAQNRKRQHNAQKNNLL